MDAVLSLMLNLIFDTMVNTKQNIVQTKAEQNNIEFNIIYPLFLYLIIP